MEIINQIRSIVNRLIASNNSSVVPDNAPVVPDNAPVVPENAPIVPENAPVVTPTPASTSNAPIIEYNPGVNKTLISVHAIEVVTNILKDSGNTRARITSSERTPSKQAQAMYNNILTQGVDRQKRLYGPSGDRVIDVYVQQKAIGKSPSEILEAMTAKIVEVGPSNISHHLADFTKLVVVDIAPSSVVHQNEFVATALKYKTNGKLSQFFYPGNGDPAYHLEIPNEILG
jgi:hypothetical protein